MATPRRRFLAAFFPFYILALVFGILVEVAPKIIANEARCAAFEAISVRTTVLLFLFVVFSSGVCLAALGSVDPKSPKWQRIAALWFVRRPALFLLDFLGPMFSICLGIATAALFAGHFPQAGALVLVSLYMPALAFLNATVISLTRRQGLAKVAAAVKEPLIFKHPRIVGGYLIFVAGVLAWFVLPITVPESGC